jgi:hypothetical protein
VVRLELTEEGDRIVNDLTHVYLAEMHKLVAVLNMLVTGEYLAHPGDPGFRPQQRLIRFRPSGAR